MLVTTAYTFAFVTVAEIGDRSQLVCMALAARHRPAQVLMGAIIAFSVMNALAVGLGTVLAEVVGRGWVLPLGGLLLIGFGAWTWFDDTDDDNDPDMPVPRGIAARPVVGTMLALLVAEFADKTQFAIASLAATEPPLAVWLGATLGLFTTSALAVGLGRLVFELAEPAVVRRVTAVFFAGTGLTMLIAQLW